MPKSKKEGKDDSTKASKSSEPDPDFFFGTGEFTLPNGDMYTGEYCAHRSGLIWREGHGVYTTKDDQIYEGEWKDDKLIENQELTIKFPNGAEYHGCIMKDKYKGPGTYTLESKMDLCCQFDGNKPTGTVTLVDYEGKLWVGTANETKATLLPENIFYLNLTEDRGKGYSVNEDSDQFGPAMSGEMVEPEKITDREWEKIIFAKSGKTDKNIDFTDCAWWKNYERFMHKKEMIETKVEYEESLSEDDKEWLEKFRRYKENKKMKKMAEKSEKALAEHDAFSLIQKFRSDDFNNSCPGVPVFYPRKDWDTSIESSSSSRHDEIVVEESVESFSQTEQLSEEELLRLAVGDTSIYKNDDIVKLKRHITALEPLICNLHFTPERELYLADLKEQAKMAEALEREMMVAANQAEEYENKGRKSTADEKGEKKDNKKPEEISLKKDEKSRLALNEADVMEARIQKYIDQYKESKLDNSNDSVTGEKTPDENKKKFKDHRHSIGVGTGSSRILIK